MDENREVVNRVVALLDQVEPGWRDRPELGIAHAVERALQRESARENADDLEHDVVEAAARTFYFWSPVTFVVGQVTYLLPWSAVREVPDLYSTLLVHARAALRAARDARSEVS